MCVSVYSFITSVLFYNLSLLAVFIFRRGGAPRAKHATSLLLFLTLLGVIRLLTPIDLDIARVIRSCIVLPVIVDALRAPMPGGLSLGQMLLVIWAIGALLFIISDLAKQRSFLKWEKSLPLTDNEQISRIASEFGDSFELRISPEIQIPFVTGLFKSTIYVPDIALGDEEWRNIFRHETQHISAHDEWKKLFFRVVRSVYWWNPLAHISESEIDTLIELQCDSRVAGSGNAAEQEGYLRTMLRLLQRKADYKAPVIASRMIGTREEMTLRFEALLSRETAATRRMRYILPALMLALFIASYFVIIQPYSLPDEAELLAQSSFEGAEPVDVLNGEMFILLENGEYHLYVDGEDVGTIPEENLSEPSISAIPIIEGGT